ncbi:MAG: glycosyltransferase, partial [Desulfofustis sp.]|nr:glycosyltransferase [Desulfofustis sp.]
MKIVIVTDTWLPQINGVVTTYVKTIRELQKRGYEVTTITPESFPTIPCPTYPEIPLSLVRPSTISQSLKRIGPNSVHIATEGPLGWAARRSCIASGFDFTTSYHTRFPEYIRMRFPVPLRLSYRVLRSFHNRGSGMMVSSLQLKKEMQERGFHNVS